MKYRDDIDGLRAIAILPVIAFHLGVPYLDSGFVGVDIFFVISGFLITGHLQTDISQGRHSVLRFYERRLRRIGPALLVMLLVCTLIGLFVLFPIELTRLARSAQSALFSVSNVHFARSLDYFGEKASEQPLVHTWSLGVEEQYYILFPLILLGTTRLSRRVRDGVIVGLFILSLLLAAIPHSMSAIYKFYLLPSRAWELLLGGMLALGIIPPPQSKMAREYCVASGLLLIAISFLVVHQRSPYLGAMLLLPCGGAALVLAGGMNGPTSAAAFLKLRPLVFIGLISYSLYLWHWPLIVFGHEIPALFDRQISTIAMNSLILMATFLIAAFSWRYVERPFRDRQRVATPRLRWSTAGVAILIGLASLSIVLTQGFPGRFSPEVNRLSAFVAYSPPYRDKCLPRQFRGEDRFSPVCLKTTGRPSYLLFGDSHAADLGPGLDQIAAGRIGHATVSGCAPLISPKGTSLCTSTMRMMYDQYIPAHHNDEVIVSSRWNPDGFAEIKKMIDWWANSHIPVVLIGPAPEYKYPLPELLARALVENDTALPQRFVAEARIKLDSKMEAYAAAKHIRYFSLVRLLCPEGVCRTMIGNTPVLWDQGHFTVEGSRYVGAALRQQGVIK